MTSVGVAKQSRDSCRMLRHMRALITAYRFDRILGVAIGLSLAVLLLACAEDESPTSTPDFNIDQGDDDQIAIGLVAQQCDDPVIANRIRISATASSRSDGRFRGGIAVALGANLTQTLCDDASLPPGTPGPAERFLPDVLQ